MFNKNAGQDAEMKSTSDSTTLIAEGTQIVGDINFQGNLEVQGTLVGKVVSDHESAQVRILNGGVVKGSIEVSNVLINGHVEGDLIVSNHARLATQAVVEGNIFYNTLEIERGAHVAGNLVHQVAATNVSILQQQDLNAKADEVKN
jgi:cytoskeletal protein CcmA (bactofilin family)